MSQGGAEILVKQDVGDNLILQQTRGDKVQRIRLTEGELNEIVQYLTQLAPERDSSYLIPGNPDTFVRVMGSTQNFTIAKGDDKLIGDQTIEQLLRYT